MVKTFVSDVNSRFEVCIFDHYLDGEARKNILAVAKCGLVGGFSAADSSANRHPTCLGCLRVVDKEK